MSRFAAGDAIGRYRVERRLGQGAMGEVWLARDPHIDRLLAVKTLRAAAGLSDDEVGDRRGRMLREARAAGRLVHPHIVTLFDAGEHEGTVFLAFEYVAGTDLGRRLAAGPPPTVGEALRIAREAAEGLAAAHRQGIVHRDVKPTNLLLDEEGRVKISDFGIAKVAGEVTELTVTGTVLGSPHYLSPEQVRGEPLDGRSDLFSLGVVLYEMLSGRRPFGGETLTTLVYQILSTEPAPLPLPAPLAPLADLLGRLLAKHRDHRLPGAAELAAELARLEATLPPELLAAVPGEEVEATLVLPSTGELLTPPPPAGPPVPPPAAAGGRISAGPHVSAETSPGRSPVAVPPPPPAGSHVSAETSSAASQPVALPTGSVPPVSGTYSLPAARPGRAGRLVLLAAAVAIAFGMGFGALFLLAPWSPGGDAPGDAETLAAGPAVPGGREAALPGDPAPGAAAAAGERTGVAPIAATPSPDRQAAAARRDAGPDPRGTDPASVPAAGTGARDARLPQPAAEAPRPGRQGGDSPTDEDDSGPAAESRSPRAADPTAAHPLAGSPSRSDATVPVPSGADTGRSATRLPSPPPAAGDAADSADDAPARPSGPALATGLRLAFRVAPADAFVLLDGTVVGKAAQFGARSPLLLPSPGEHRITLRRAGMADRHLRVFASDSTAGISPIVAALQPLKAAETPFHELEVHRVGKAVAFRVDPPSTRVLVDGVDRGLAMKYRGGRLRGGSWLELPLGMHRVSLVAPGRRRLDVVVDVTSGADEERRVVRLTLPPLPEGER